MYLRFISGVKDTDSGLYTGIFGPAIDRLYDDKDMPRWLWREMRRTVDWFNNNLDAPARLYGRRRKGRNISGVCWFRATATDHIRHARYLAWLVSEAGDPIREIRCRKPGEIIWRDEYQIVAARDHASPMMRLAA